MHYRPKTWTMTRDEPRFAIPPYWADGLPAREEEEPASSSQQQSNDDGRVAITFTNTLHDDVELKWINPQGQSETHQANIPAHGEIMLNSYVGHSFVALSKSTNKVVGRVTLDASHNQIKMDIGSANANEL
jgi:hypothetical protein